MFGRKKCIMHLWAVALILVLMSCFITPAWAGAGDLSVSMTSHAAGLISSSDAEVVYRLNDPVDGQNLLFDWNFSHGLDNHLQANMERVSLRTSGGDSIVINYDTELQYLKQNDPVELRQLTLKMIDSGKLQPDTDYVVEMASDMESNNGNTLGKTYAWYFSTQGTDDNEPSDENQEESGSVSPLTIDAYSPEAIKTVDEYEVIYQVKDALRRDGVHFVWEFSNGIEKNLVDNLNGITLKKEGGILIPIDRGSTTQDQISGNIIEMGDFKYTKQNNPELRQLEFILQSCSLEPDTTYNLELDATIQANNGDTLMMDHVWTFSTQDDSISTPPESTNDGSGGSGEGSGEGSGSGAGTGTSGGMTVGFHADDLSPGQTILHLDFSKGIDDNLEANLGRIKIYEKTTGKTITYSDYQYVREGTTETGNKIRRLILFLYNLKPETAYGLELDQDFAANNGSTLGYKYAFEFVTKAANSGSATIVPTNQTQEEKNEEQVVVEKANIAGLNRVVFSDIQGHWAQKNIEELIERGAINGYPDQTFQPGRSITRAEFISVLVKALSLEPGSGRIFTDTANHWARTSIATAAAHGITNGYDENRFGPDDLISREQIAVMLQKAALLSYAGEKSVFSDTELISDWAADAVCICSGYGVVKGYEDNTFRPQRSATRAEAAAMIVRAITIPAE